MLGGRPHQPHFATRTRYLPPTLVCLPAGRRVGSVDTPVARLNSQGVTIVPVLVQATDTSFLRSCGQQQRRDQSANDGYTATDRLQPNSYVVHFTINSQYPVLNNCHLPACGRRAALSGTVRVYRVLRRGNRDDGPFGCGRRSRNEG